jgi:hypothetical protein
MDYSPSYQFDPLSLICKRFSRDKLDETSRFI